MKWGSEAKNDDRRCIIKYAWYPIRIQNRWSDPKIEWRWLETVKIRQEYKNYAYHIDNPFKMIYCELKIFLFGGFWENELFVEFNKDELRDQKLKKLGI
jgi:hypothetical protein